MHLDQIGPEDIDRYKAEKLREGALGPNQINKSLGLLAMILDAAGDYGHIDAARNPARGRRRRVKRSTPRRPTVEPEQLPSLLEASRKLRPMVATMAGAGLRNGETCGLNWLDFDPASGTLTVGESKTEAGIRQVDLPDALRKELAAYKLRTLRSSEGPMFRNRKGQRQSVSNVERRLKTAIRRANKRLDELGLRPIDEAVTPHSLRRLYASLRFALGDDPVYVANQLGHTEPGFSMKVYASAVRRRERLIGVALREFDAALEWASNGQRRACFCRIRVKCDRCAIARSRSAEPFPVAGPTERHRSQTQFTFRVDYVRRAANEALRIVRRRSIVEKAPESSGEAV
jgi:integrase